MKQRTKAIIATLTLGLMLPFMMIPASANSALTEWEGSKENVVMTTDGESPIVVEHETLTFDIQELVDTYAYSSEKYDPTKEYKSSVTAEYNFYNPSDMTVKAQLAFPIGSLGGNFLNQTIHGKYYVKVNGENIESKIRHTYSIYGEFDLERDLPHLQNDYATHEFITPDTKVTKYVFDVNLVNENDSGYPRVYVDLDTSDYGNTKVYSNYHANDIGDGVIRYTRNNLVDVPIYFIGEVPDKMPEFTVFKDIFKSDDIEILPSTSRVKEVKTMTFRDLAFAGYKEEYGISEMDWYNAVMLGASRDSAVYYSDYFSLEPRDFLCWYTYELEFEPGERIVNSVTAPMIPGQNINYNPRHFKYTYLISPAVTWADFGSLDIYVNTPYYMVKSNIDGFEKTESGYYLHLDGLPMTDKRLDFGWNEITTVEPEVKDFHFSLCESETSEYKNNGSTMSKPLTVILTILAIILFPITLIVWIINLIVQAVKRGSAK